jgi:hypothetical protein
MPLVRREFQEPRHEMGALAWVAHLVRADSGAALASDESPDQKGLMLRQGLTERVVK